jgi:chemotaxis protein CheZ
MPADLATAASPWTVTAAPARGEPNYDAIYAAVVSTAEGRWFLAQYASRNRNTDTVQVLAAMDRLETELSRERSAAPAAPAPDPPPDIARLRRDLGDLADALVRTRADIAAIKPGKVTERPSILAATEALQGLAWFMRERGMEPRFCDRIDDCADDIHAVCAMPDLTAQRIRAIVGVLGDLENRLHAISATLDDCGGDQFGDLPASPAANANSAAAKPATLEAGMAKAKVVEAKVVEAEEVGADIAAFTAERRAEIEPLARRDDTGNAAPVGTETFAASLPPALATERYRNDRPAAANPGSAASPRLSHLLMAAELDRLLDAQAAIETGTNDLVAPEPAAVTAPLETTAPTETAPPRETAATIEAAIPVEATAPIEAASPPTIEVEPAPPEPEAPTMPAAPPPRRIAVIAKHLFADVMALSEEERIALFT